MRKIVCVTFPRSGHHLIANVLFKYFSRDLSIPEIFGEKTKDMCTEIVEAGKLFYCEFYNHCRSFPCTDLRTNFQKNHDYNLDLKIDSNYSYVIIYRNPIESLISLYNFYTSNPFENVFFGKKIGYGQKGWEEFAKEWIIFWKNFVNKWVTKSNSNLLFISYEELINFPRISIINVIKLIAPDKVVNIDFLNDCVKKTKIEKKSNIKNFKYYDENFMKELEKGVLDEIKMAGLNPVFN